MALRTRGAWAVTALLAALVLLASGVTPANATAPSPAVPPRAANALPRISPLGAEPHSTSVAHPLARAQQQQDQPSPQQGYDPGNTQLGTPLPLGNLPLGTFVTNQFAKDGIIFSGQSPFITDDGSSSINPTISGSPLFQGTVVGTFVKPGTNKPATVNTFSISVGYIDNPGSTQMVVFGANGNQLGVLVATQLGFNTLYSTFPNAASFDVFSTANEPAGWEMNTIQVGPITTTYIAMGDSYSSGEGTNDFPWSQSQGTQCDTGPEAWPVQLAYNEINSSTGATLSIGPDTLVACQGERSYQLDQAVNGESLSEIDQVNQYVANNGSPDLVTLTIGGNDLGFADILAACFVGGTEVCIHEIHSLDSKVVANSASLIATLAAAYEEVANAAGSDTQVAVVGYPDLFPNPGGLGTALSVTYHCPWLRDTFLSFFPPFISVSPFINDLLGDIVSAQASLNDDMSQAASEAGVQFIPIPTSLQGHELCTGSPDINGLNPLHSGLINNNRNSGHPNVTGQGAIAASVANQLGLGGSGGSDGQPDIAALTAHPASTSAPMQTKVAPRVAVAAALSVSGGPLLDGTLNDPYLDFLTASGGNGADTWSLTSGTLPGGLTLDPQAGTISGMPTATGTFNFTVSAQDASTPTAQTATGSFSITIGTPAALAISTTTMPDATIGQPYDAAVVGSGGRGQLTWSVASGALPTGLRLDANTGEITGTPNTAGSSTFSIGVSDDSTPIERASASLALTVHPASDPLTVNAAPLPEIAVGQSYAGELTSTGGLAPITWSVTSGSLPPGLSLDDSTGVLTGTPTAAGTYPFTAQVADATAPTSQTASGSFSITIDPGPALAITTAQLFDGTAGSYYSSTVQTTGGAGSDQFYVSSGSLPQGLSLNGSTGQITGVPSQGGSDTFGVTVFDGAGNSAEQDYSVSITQNPLTVSSSLAPATVGTYYIGNVSPSGGSAPYGYTVLAGDLPSGLSFDAGTGAIVGTPSESGAFPLQVQVTDGSSPPQSVTADLTLNVAPAPLLAVTPGALVDGVVGYLYTTGVGYSGGLGPDTWQITSGSLPPGLSIDQASGMITGSPTTTGTYPFTISATDSTTPTPETSTASVSITIDAPPVLAVTGGALPLATQGSAYAAFISPTGGTQPYSFALTSGALPDGLSLDGSGEISGTPSGSGPSSFTVQVTDSASPTPSTTTANLTLTVDPAPTLTVTTTGLDNATQASSYDEQLVADGGVAPYTWSVTGKLPAGLQLSTSGELSGTPSAFGSSTFTVVVTDSATPNAGTAQAKLTLDVEASPPAAPVFVQDQPASPLQVNEFYQYQFSAMGSPPPTYSVTNGHLPKGLLLSKSGLLSGTTTKAGTFTFEVTATNGRSPDAVTTPIAMSVVPSPVITGFNPAQGVVGTKVTITGTGLANAYYVYFNGNYATITQDTQAKIVVTVPVGAGSGYIYVDTPGGFTGSPTSFTVLPSPPPTITSISPRSAAAGAILTIRGTNLALAQEVEFNGATVFGFTKDTGTVIQVAVPAGIAAGPVTVVTEGGSATSTQTFTPTSPPTTTPPTTTPPAD